MTDGQTSQKQYASSTFGGIIMKALKHFNSFKMDFFSHCGQYIQYTNRVGRDPEHNFYKTAFPIAKNYVFNRKYTHIGDQKHYICILLSLLCLLKKVFFGDRKHRYDLNQCVYSRCLPVLV